MENTIKERVKVFCLYKHIPVSKFESECGLSNAYISSMRKSFGTEKLDNVLKAFPELNREWLLYGEGEMLKSEVVSEENNVEDAVIVPFIDRSSARERNLSVRKILNTDQSLKQIQVDELFDPVDFYKKMHDDSMSETIQQGDYLFIKLLPRDANLVNGSIYLIDTKSYGILVRKVLVVDAETYELVPINETYGKITIKREDIIDFGIVVHLLRSSFHVPNGTIQSIASESTKQVSSLIEELRARNKRYDNLIDKILKDK
jgi:SOS-response transcriptional repressor LexA